MVAQISESLRGHDYSRQISDSHVIEEVLAGKESDYSARREE